MANTISRRTAVTSILAAAGTGVVLSAKASASAAEEQPHMRAALDALHTAQSELAQATADKGGHRVAAEKHVREAIAEVEAGMRFDNHHP